MKKKQVHLEKKLMLEKMIVASMVKQPGKIVGGAGRDTQNTVCYTICATVCLGHACA
ncbi:hypothetical protein [Chitinophaga sp. Cy-1792]|uniref:hypothetical protein n=1 Tax=Chitinophaga sp. Cy-1792 TaxID=2608339 RepID=UPI001421CE11|nr:hypothetical protein [Chitinophaga sp. Cy-1792]